MAEATLLSGLDRITKTAAAATATGEVQQLADGRAGVYSGFTAAAQGSDAAFYADKQFQVAKTSGIVILDGGRVYWDYSANAATYCRQGDRDFYLGRAVGDAASADTVLTVALNVNPKDDIAVNDDAMRSVLVGTQALGGFNLVRRGGCHNLLLDATSEAQKLDLLSVDS